MLGHYTTPPRRLARLRTPILPTRTSPVKVGSPFDSLLCRLAVAPAMITRCRRPQPAPHDEPPERPGCWPGDLLHRWPRPTPHVDRAALSCRRRPPAARSHAPPAPASRDRDPVPRPGGRTPRPGAPPAVTGRATGRAKDSGSGWAPPVPASGSRPCPMAVTPPPSGRSGRPGPGQPGSASGTPGRAAARRLPARGWQPAVSLAPASRRPGSGRPRATRRSRCCPAGGAASAWAASPTVHRQPA